jgi:hypothetical protein
LLVFTGKCIQIINFMAMKALILIIIMFISPMKTTIGKIFIKFKNQSKITLALIIPIIFNRPPTSAQQKLSATNQKNIRK